MELDLRTYKLNTDSVWKESPRQDSWPVPIVGRIPSKIDYKDVQSRPGNYVMGIRESASYMSVDTFVVIGNNKPYVEGSTVPSDEVVRVNAYLINSTDEDLDRRPIISAFVDSTALDGVSPCITTSNVALMVIMGSIKDSKVVIHIFESYADEGDNKTDPMRLEEFQKIDVEHNVDNANRFSISTNCNSNDFIDTISIAVSNSSNKQILTLETGTMDYDPFNPKQNQLKERNSLSRFTLNRSETDNVNNSEQLTVTADMDKIRFANYYDNDNDNGISVNMYVYPMP